MKLNKLNCVGELKASATRVDITDIGEKTYKGFLLKNCTIVDRIQAKVNCLQIDSKVFVLISLDECSIRRKFAKIILDNLSQDLQMPKSQILFTCVHTHSAHDMCSADLIKLSKILVDGVRTALSKLVIVNSIKQSIGKIDHVVNRRVPLPENLGGYCVMFNNDCVVDENQLKLDASKQVNAAIKKSEGDAFANQNQRDYLLRRNVDQRVHLWQLLDQQGKTVFSIVRVNAHPVIVSQSRVGEKISGDFASALEKLIETKLGGICSLLNGAFGDTRPLTNDYGFEARDRFAKRCFDSLISGEITEAKTDKFTWFHFEDVQLELRDDLPRNIDEIKALHQNVLNDIQNQKLPMKRNYDILETIESFLLDSKNHASAIINKNEIEEGFVSCDINGWVLGPMKILALPGEPLTAFARLFEKDYGVLPIGLANGYISYLPDANTVNDGGYEANQNILNDRGLNQLVNLSRYFRG